MVTGDNIETAIAIAKEAGIIQSAAPNTSTKFKGTSGRFRCMTGAEFRKQVGGLRGEVVMG